MLNKYNHRIQRKIEYLNIFVLCAAAIVLIALELKILGFLLLGGGLASLFLCSKNFRRNIALIYGAAALLGLTPINTSTDLAHIFTMGLPMLLLVAGPYYITKYVYKNNLVRFPFGRGRDWKKREIFYVLFTVVLGFLILPPMLRSGSSFQNWEILPGAWNLAESYVGLNFVGIWDELFFISTVSGIFRKHLPFWAANLAQAVFFTSFLYNVGFQGWGPAVIFPFALSQGYIFKKTGSLLYVLTIHLSLDLVLHLTLVYLHHPSWLPFFIT